MDRLTSFLSAVIQLIQQDINIAKSSLPTGSHLRLVGSENKSDIPSKKDKFLLGLFNDLVKWRISYSNEEISEVLRGILEQMDEYGYGSNEETVQYMLRLIFKNLSEKLKYPIRGNQFSLGYARGYIDHGLKILKNEERILSGEYAREIVDYIEEQLKKDLEAIEKGILNARQMKVHQKVFEYIAELEAHKKYITENTTRQDGVIKIKEDIVTKIQKYILENIDQTLMPLSIEGELTMRKRTGLICVFRCFVGENSPNFALGKFHSRLNESLMKLATEIEPVPPETRKEDKSKQ